MGEMFELPKTEVMIYGPLAEHNHPCCICREKHSVLDLSRGVMEPCWSCQKEGWRVEKGKKRFVSRFWEALGGRP